MNRIAAMLLCCAFSAGSVSAAERVIDLSCALHGQRLIERILSEQVVTLSVEQAQKIQAISTELCQGAEVVATKQQQVEQEKVLKNWFFSDQTGGKAGNERLKKIK